MEVVDKVTLFGEIDQPQPAAVATKPIAVEKTPTVNNVAIDVKKNNDNKNNAEEENLEDNLRLRIIQVATGSKGFFKHQQIGEPDLSKEEKRSIVTSLLEEKPELFLNRFGKFLSEDHLSYFENLGLVNYEVGFYLKEARQQQCRFVREQRIKNRRFRAMQQMISDGDDHFSEESMRQRNPLLYDQLVRQHQSEEERSAAERPDMTNCSLSNIIMEHMDLDRERKLKKRLEGEEDEEEFDTDSEEEEEDEQTEMNLEVDEKQALRNEFVQTAYQSFIAGRDPGINYQLIDEDSNLDDLNLENRENEERYFDEDEVHE